MAWHWQNSPHMREAWGGEPEPHTPLPDPPPLRVVKIDGSRLRNGTPKNHLDGHSNASIIRWRGKLLLAYRHRWWGAQVWITELDDDTYQPANEGYRLNLDNHHTQHGSDDPRFFAHMGRLGIIVAGVDGKYGPTSQLIAWLDDSLQVEQIVYLDLPGRKEWEKNWQVFSHGGHLYAVYTISPHVVLKIEDDGRCNRVHNTPITHPWSGGELRGGAAPVRVGEEFFSFFHGLIAGGVKTYSMGCYTFAAKPPFQVLRMTPRPICWGDSRSRPKGWWANNYFPVGAILENNTWIISAGVHDREIHIAEWDAADVCKALLTPQGAKARKPCGCSGANVRAPAAAIG